MRKLLAIATIIFSPALLAQDTSASFQLFEEVQSNDSSNTEQQVRRESRVGGSSSAPEFTLVGTSRIGNRHTVMLKHRSGDVIHTEVDPDGITEIPGHRDFDIVAFGAGRLAIRFPGDSLCIEDASLGVSCSETQNLANLSLALGEPVLRSTGDSESSTNAGRANNNNDQEASNTSNNSGNNNPFRVLQEAAASRNNPGTNSQSANGSTQNRSIQVRRIPPNEVPDGYRVVSTPFGDRLVEE